MFLAARLEVFWKACTAIVVDNRQVDTEGLMLMLASPLGDEALVHVQVVAAALK